MARILAISDGFVEAAGDTGLQRLRDLERNNPMQVPPEGGTL